MSIPPPETLLVETRRVACDGATGIRGGKGYRPAALGHPRVFLEIDEHGYVDCGYWDGAAQGALGDIASGADAGHP